jgi:hypothetical protein
MLGREDMSETRRELFKASIFSAIGLMGVSGVAGCTRSFGPTFRGGDDGQPPAVILGLLQDPNKKSSWYVFRFDGDNNKYQALSLNDPNKLPSQMPSVAPFDVVDFNAGLADSDVTLLTTTKLKGAGLPNGLNVQGGYVMNSNDLINYYTLPKAVPRWNEIGKQ